MKTCRANKGGQAPQRAPRTPGVRSQALHLCANGAGLGIRDYQSPELLAAARSLCQEGSGRFLGPTPHLPPEPVLSEAEGLRDSAAHWGELGRGRPPINRQHTWLLPMGWDRCFFLLTPEQPAGVGSAPQPLALPPPSTWPQGEAVADTRLQV
jgi:hypothetical protein